MSVSHHCRRWQLLCYSQTGILFERRQQQCQNLHVMVTTAYIIYCNCWAWAICHLSTSLCDELPQTCAKTNRFITLLSVLIWLIFSNLDRSVLCVFLYNFVCMMCDCLIQPCDCQISINDWLIDWLRLPCIITKFYINKLQPICRITYKKVNLNPTSFLNKLLW